jgi:hypothetical protein
MSIRTLLIVPLAVAGLLSVSPTVVEAQLGPPPLTRSPRPVTSPYLNLLATDDPDVQAFQYYRRVRPEVELRQSAERQGSAIRGLRQEVEADRRALLMQSPTSLLGTTGHPTQFLNYGGYFRSPAARPQGMLEGR